MTLTTDICAVCEKTLDEIVPGEACRIINGRRRYHQLELVTMNARVHQLAVSYNLRHGRGFRPNFWNGADLTGSPVRLVLEDEGIRVLVFSRDGAYGPTGGVLYAVRFDAETPAAVIDAAVRVAVAEAAERAAI